MVRLMTIAMLVAGTLSFACSSDGTPEGTVAPGAASVAASPTSTATPRPVGRTVTAVPTEDPTPVPPDIGVVVMDAATGETAELYRGGEWMLNGVIYPRFVGDDSAVWLSVESWQEARRFAPDGQMLLSIDGWGVFESKDGGSRSYHLFNDEGLPTRDVVVERDGVRRVLEGRFARRTFSPEGTRIALETFGEDSFLELFVLDIESGELRELATEVGPCGCDGGPSPKWSPSGRYLAYSDFDYHGLEGPLEDYGNFVADVLTGETVQLVSGRAWLPGPWGDGDTIEYRYGTELWRYHARTGARELIVTAPEHASARLLGENYIVIDESSGGAPWSYETALVDRASGEEIERWPGMVELTPVGDEIAIIARKESPTTCVGVWVDHPQLDEPLCFHDATWWASWSPGGTKLAVLRHVDGDSSVIEVIDLRSGESVVSEPIDANVSSIGWNDAGTYVIVSWGTGV